MSHRRITIIAVAFALAPLSLLHAGPADLLDQAIDENKGQKPIAAVDSAEVDSIVRRAELLYDAREFADAVRLFEKAYRLAPQNRATYARLLVAKRAAGMMTDADAEALAIIEEEARASVAATFRNVRLAMIQSKQALASGDLATVESQLDGAENLLNGLPPDVDATPYRRQLTQMRKSLARERSEGRATNQATRHESDSETLWLSDTGETPQPKTETTVEVDMADGAETGEIIDVDELLAATSERLRYDRDLDRAIAAARANTLLTAAEAALPPSPQGGMTFPSDWAERTAKRAKYRDGMIYRSPEFKGADGQTYYTAIYDLGDLVHPVPNFYAPWALTGRQQRIQDDDRFWLQYRSQIYNGYAEDLAAGLPLLHFFGGIDNYAVSTQTDPRETQRIVTTIERFIQGG